MGRLKFECHGFFSDGCHAESEHDIDLSYFQSLGYLQTVAFTIGYGHISPTCNSGQVFYCLILKSNCFLVIETPLGAIKNAFKYGFYLQWCHF